jgi:hypothetical protein
MSDNRKVEKYQKDANYNSLAACINYEYSTKFKYDFLYYRPYLNDIDEIKLYNCNNPTTNNLRHASWSKLLSTSLALELSYDYIVYIDSDCVFKDFDQSLELFIQPHLDKDIIFLNNKPWGDNLPCAGFYICKVNTNTKQFILDWYNVNIPEKDMNHPWEQDALWKIYTNYNIAIVDSWMFQESSGQFLRHIWHGENHNRIPYFSSIISKGMNYEKNISREVCE